jgi:hypothetical protein
MLLALLFLTALMTIAGCPGPGPEMSRTLDSITITNPPSKLAYVKGEALDLSGLEVIATWSDGNTVAVELTAENISYDSEAVGDVEITVTVSGKTAAFWVAVSDPVSDVAAFGAAHAAVLARSPSSVADAETAAALESGVDAALAAYDALGDAARTLAAAHRETLDTLKLRIEDLLAPARAEAFKAAHEAALALTVDTLTVADEPGVDAALEAHSALSQAVRELTAAEKTLLDSLKQRAGQLVEKAAFAEAHGAALALTVDTVAVADEPGVDAALAAHNALSQGTQELTVAEKGLLDSLKIKIADLRAAANADEADKAAAADFVSAHAAILGKTVDTVTAADEPGVDAAIGAHNALTAQVKALTGSQKNLLDSLKTKITDTKTAATFKTNHAVVLEKTVDTVAAGDEAGTDAALGAYNALDAGVRALLAGEKALLDALKLKIAFLNAAAADQAEATAFKTEHAGVLGKTIDTVAVGDEAAVDAALAAYNALKAAIRALLAAERDKLDSFKIRIEEQRAPAAAAAFKTDHAVILGKTLDAVAAEDEAAVDAALAAHDALGAGVTALLAAEKDKLDSFKTRIEEQKAPAAAAAFRTDHAAALALTTAAVTTGDEAGVNAALSAYAGLSAPAKSLLAAEKETLDLLQQRINALKGEAADQAGAGVFRTAHAGILAKTAAAVGIADEAAVDAALAAYNALRQGSKTLVAGEKDLLDALKARIVQLIEEEGIFTAAELAKIGVDPAYPANGRYTLMADLVLNDWTPLCPDQAHAFSGTFDGNGHAIAITGFNNAAVQGQSYLGIFGYVKGASSAEKAAIRNVRIVSSVDAASTRDGGQSLGLIAGYTNLAVIENIGLEGSLRFTALIGVVYVGGVAGWIEQETLVRDCSGSMNMNITGGYDVPLDPNIVVYSSIGGFVGLFKHRSEIRGCHNTGNVSGGGARPSDALVASRGPAGNGSTDGATTNDPNHAQAYVGGIAGGSYFGFVAGGSGSIYNCSSYGDITAGASGWWAFAAGISGCFQGAVRMEQCVAGGTIRAISQYAYAGGMTAYGSGDAVFYRCRFTGNIKPGAYYTAGPITGQYGQVIECEWTTVEPAPQAAYDFNGKLTGLAANMAYTVNGEGKTADASGAIPIADDWFGSSVVIIKTKASQVAAGDSPPQTLAIPQRPAAPTGLTASGSAISGVNASMEWAPFGTAGTGAAWTGCVGSSVTGLTPGSYYVRYKRTAAVFASANAVVAVSLSISSAADLAKIGVDPAWPVDGAYSLAADITLDNWTPLEFAGNFNGNGRRITIGSIDPVVTFNEFNWPVLNVGIFSTITGPSYEMPVVIENLNISIGAGAYALLDGLAPDDVGTLAGTAKFALLANIHVGGQAVAFRADETSHLARVGGIVGLARASVLKDCSNSAAIDVAASVVGGIAGVVVSLSYSPETGNFGPSTVEACYATGTITTVSAETERSDVGGNVGIVTFSTVKRSSYAGSITVSRGNDKLATAYPTTGVGGIVGTLYNNPVSPLEDCHSSGVFTGISTNTGGNNSGMAVGGIVGLSEGGIQRCYSTADLHVQRNAAAYAGGIIGYLWTYFGSIVRITACAALNAGIKVESDDGSFAPHRVAGATVGNGGVALSRNIAWSAMPLWTQQTGQAAQPFTEVKADKTGFGLAGADCDRKPTQQEYYGWDFSAVWRMGADGYPELR